MFDIRQVFIWERDIRDVKRVVLTGGDLVVIRFIGVLRIA
jgi:signal peptidase I